MKINRMDFLIWFYIFAIFASEVMWAKTFPLINIFWYQLNASVAIFLMPLIYSINDIIIEVYWKERMKQIIRLSIIIIIFIILVSIFFTSLPASSRFAELENSYDAIFWLSIRISIASLIAFSLADFLDVYIFSKLREKMKNTKLWLRTNISNIISTCFDTFIFYILAFYALEKNFLDNLSFIVSIWLPYWVLKCVMSILVTPLVYLWVKELKKDLHSLENKKNLGIWHI